MKIRFPLFLLTLVTLSAYSQDKPAYILYNQDGKEVKYAKMLKELEDADIIFFGELHTDPIAHWMQIELTRDLFEKKKDNLVLGAEMFEADNQMIMDEYLNSLYPASKFEAEMRLWNNYETDYKPLVVFAKENRIRFVASNIPRRYASMVHKGGFEALNELSAEALSFIAPLPIAFDPEVKCYKDMLDMGKEDAPTGMKDAPEGMKDTLAKVEPPLKMPPAHGKGPASFNMENLAKAQAAKDATMAHFILKNWSEGKIMFHFNGSYHSTNHQGIIWHIEQQAKDLTILTIETVLQKEIDTLDEEHLNAADYVICIPESMTRTGR